MGKVRKKNFRIGIRGRNYCLQNGIEHDSEYGLTGGDDEWRVSVGDGVIHPQKQCNEDQ